MKNQSTLFSWRRVALGASLAVLSAVFLPSYGIAQNIPLSNGGSTANINLGGGGGAIGMNSWEVYNGKQMQNQLDQQWFWYSINGGAVQSIDQIGAADITSETGSSLSATYQNSTLAVQVTYTLQGDGVDSGGGTLNESVNVINVSPGNFNINFYQFANFNLLQNNDNVLTINGGPGNYSSILQTTSVGGNGIEETIGQPPANYAEAGDPGSVMGDVTAGNQLNGNINPSAGPGDVAWGLEWANSLAPFDGNPANIWDVLQGENMSITPVPEPATAGLVALGLGAFGLARRAWRRNI